MSDPGVYNDHREAAEVGRRLKELEAPWKLAQAWKQARADLAAARGDAELGEMVADYEARRRPARRGVEGRARRARPRRRQGRDHRDPRRRRGRGGKLWAGDLAKLLQRYAERRGFKWEEIEVTPSDTGGLKEGTFAIKATARTRSSSSRAARTASNACPRRSRRGGFTRRRRPWR